MNLIQNGMFYIGTLEDCSLSDKEKAELLKLGNEDTQEEILDLAAEAEKIACPKALYTVCSVEAAGDFVQVNGVNMESALVTEKLKGKNRCFPYIVTCGTELNAWAEQYAADPLAEYWAEEIKLLYLQKIMKQLFPYLKETYRTGGHFTALNPGSLESWPISGEQELFDILGGAEYVKRQIGVAYTESFLMIPNKSASGIGFESEVFFENCMRCPLTGCPNRRASCKE